MNNGSVDSRDLSEREEELLARFFDNEASFFERFRVKSLRRMKPAATDDFLQSLAVIREISRGELAGVLKDNPVQVDLWQGINQRLDEEERLAIYYHSDRAVSVDATPEQESFVSRLMDRFAWSVSGGVVAACATFLLIQPSPQPFDLSRLKSSSFLQSVSGHGGEVSPVVSRSQIYRRSAPHVVEVDWMRSDGRVQMLHEPTDHSAMIWVRKRQPIGSMLSRGGRGIVSESAIPVGAAPIEVLDQRIPQSIPVSNR